jgi:CDP-diacylglycerol--glycerol-3-phosphate 3-phosphatidyltransferase
MSEVYTIRSFAHLLTLPTLITFLRLLIIPFIILFFYLPFEQGTFYAGILFLLGAMTDWLDGFIARRFNMVSAFGAFIDPVADKLLVAVTLVILVEVYAQFWIVLPALVIIAREILISALREWMATIGQQAQVKVSGWGKLKTFVQMVAIFWLMVMPHDASEWVITLAAIVLYIAMGLTVWSMIQYLQAAWPILSGEQQDVVQPVDENPTADFSTVIDENPIESSAV